MKIKKLFGICTVLTLLSFSSVTVFATGYPVFDVSGWLAAIDQLYQAYDMVNNTITQIENQYKAIDQAIEAAKGINWEEVEFDGDFDIRNEIRDATSQVNRNLTKIRKVKEAIATPSINIGYKKYSVADLCGAGSADITGSRRNMFTAIEDYSYYMSENTKTAVKDITEGLTDQQRRAIWIKYGISPENYAFIQEAQNYVLQAAGEAISSCTDEIVQAHLDDNAMRRNTIIQSALESKNAEGNMTEGAYREADIMLTGEMLNAIDMLNLSLNDCARMAAAKMISDQRQKDAEEMTKQLQKENEEWINKQVNPRFR